MATATGTDITSHELLEAVREVEVTRRLYRSGESEYLIDGHICRLRDIHELLMDTGLGAKAYAIIEQGKIGLILSSRPTDRRQLIEEAAGITKYKARRRAAELKLEAAQQNLTRIDDIVFEVEKQRGSLKRQAAKARRYTRLRDEMRRWEKVLFARRYRALGEVIESARGAPGRHARAGSRAPRRAWRKSKTSSDGCASSWPKPKPRPRACARPRTRASSRSTGGSSRSRSTRSRPRCCEARGDELEVERATLDARREPERLALEERRAAALEAERAREESAALAAAAAAEHAQRAAGDRGRRAGRRAGARAKSTR